MRLQLYCVATLWSDYIFISVLCSISVTMSVSFCLSVCLSVYLFACLSVSQSSIVCTLPDAFCNQLDRSLPQAQACTRTNTHTIHVHTHTHTRTTHTHTHTHTHAHTHTRTHNHKHMLNSLIHVLWPGSFIHGFHIWMKMSQFVIHICHIWWHANRHEIFLHISFYVNET